mgnify:FL=1
MKTKQIVGVKFESKFKPGTFYGNEYSYYVVEGLDLKVGDIVQVPTKYGDGRAMVTRTGIKEYQIDECILPYMLTIEKPPINPKPSTAVEDFFEGV